MIWVGIIGAKGYFGEELSRIIAGHPKAQLSTVMDLQEFGDSGEYMCGSFDTRPGYWNMVNAVKKSDVIFNGLTGNVAEEVYRKALSYGKKVIDISDRHFAGGQQEGNDSAYPGSVYGLPELYKDKIEGATIVANPSSYCAGAFLGLAPLVVNDMVDINSAVIESKSGITSLRRNDKLIDTNIIGKSGLKTYKMDSKAYDEEVNEQMLALFGEKTSIALTSYIIPGFGGITTTINVKFKPGIDGSDIASLYRDFYKNNSFVEVYSKGKMPELKNEFDKQFCKIGTVVDADSRSITVTTTMDNVVKGVASQAVQSMNLMYGIDGKIGL